MFILVGKELPVLFNTYVNRQRPRNVFRLTQNFVFSDSMDRSDHHLTILSPISSTTEPDLIVVTSTFLYLSQFTVVP